MKKAPEFNQSKRIAVLPFKDAMGRSGSGAIATEAFSTQILTVQSYSVIDRNALAQVLDEQKLGQTGIIDQSKAVEIGKLLGADGVIVGSVTEFEPRKYLIFPPAKVSLTARLIDTKTGEVEWSAEHRVGGAKRWLWWFIWPIGVITMATSPSAEDQVANASRDVCKAVQRQIVQQKP